MTLPLRFLPVIKWAMSRGMPAWLDDHSLANSPSSADELFVVYGSGFDVRTRVSVNS